MPPREQGLFPYRMAAGMTESGRGSGAIVDRLSTTGDVLFRWRSYMPLLLIPLFVLSVRDDRPPAPFAWEVACFAVALSGLLFRVFVIGTAPEGTSARGTRRPTADVLMTSGAYSMVRHPLYLANTLMWLGCAMLSWTWSLPVIVLLLSFIYHERIAAREETFLANTFGEAFRDWTRTVPAMIPRVDHYHASGVSFQARKVFTQESHGLLALGTAFVVLDTIEDSMRLHMLHVDPRWLMVFAATAVPFLIAVVMKKAEQRTQKI
jgi:protein-S-isoprenylcysteine O-methyltransferase Ste14